MKMYERISMWFYIFPSISVLLLMLLSSDVFCWIYMYFWGDREVHTCETTMYDRVYVYVCVCVTKHKRRLYICYLPVYHIIQCVFKMYTHAWPMISTTNNKHCIKQIMRKCTNIKCEKMSIKIREILHQWIADCINLHVSMNVYTTDKNVLNIEFYSI